MTQNMARSAKAKETCSRILDAALACFAESGLQGTTTRTIAARAGVTQPLIHHYFGSKEALFDAVVARSVDEYDEVQQPRWAMPRGDVRFFVEGLAVLFRWLGDNQQMLRLMTWARLEGRAQVSEGNRRIYQKVRDRLTAAQQLGVVRPEADIDMVLVLLDVALKGYWERHRALHGYSDGVDFTDRYFAELMRVVMQSTLTAAALAEIEGAAGTAGSRVG